MGLLTPTVVKTSWSLLTSLRLAVSVSFPISSWDIWPAWRPGPSSLQKGGALMATMVGESAVMGRT